jgi:asparagine synthase (glutamine-hydrolysing)
MCGLAGLFFREISSDDRKENIAEILKRMTASLVLRGPDGFGHLVLSQVAFGHRRLSILDLSENGAQPMRLENRGLAITYNGEVYNFQELKRELETLGCVFRGHSDTEVVLMAYATWGLEGLKKLEGIFALALWDASARRLVLMRDRFGVKPLYYGESSEGLAFGSEIKAILLAGGVDTSLDDQSLSEYLWYGNTHGNRTIYNGVRALEPGYWLIIENQQRRIEPWWRIEEWLANPLTARSPNEAAIQVRDALDKAVSRQLIADVPVGIFLSGGVDSSSIAAAAMQNLKRPLESFAAGFDFEGGVNELPKAKQVADHLGLNHHELHIRGGDLESVIVTLARAHDEPFADAANIPLYLMCQHLGGRMKVVLQGDGGDEIFAGYRRYAVLRNAYWWRLFPSVLLPLFRYGGKLGKRFARMAGSVGHPDPAMRMAFLLTMETPHRSPEACFLLDRRRELTKTTDPFLPYRKAADRFQEYDAVQQMLLTDLTVQLPSQFLPKVDRATMAAGVEARVPLLDENVARLAVAMPADWKVKGIEKKVVLRNSQRGRLPSSILDGPKTGFGVPYENWLGSSLNEFARGHLLDVNFLQRFGLDPELMEGMLTKHRERADGRGFLLWKLLQLAIWNSFASTYKH